MNAIVAVELSAAATILEAGLDDASRSVRIEAASNLLLLPKQVRSESAAPKLTNALQELEESLMFNNDRGGAHLVLGSLASNKSATNKL